MVFTWGTCIASVYCDCTDVVQRELPYLSGTKPRDCATLRMTSRLGFRPLATLVRWCRHAVRVALACASLAVAGTAMAQRAGSEVRNVANADLTVDGAPERIASNPATLRIAERLDLRLAATGSFAVDGPGSAVPFLLTNSGNGDERFVLSATLAGISGQVRGFAIDTNANGVLDPADTPIAGLTPLLAPQQSLTLLAILDPGPVEAGATLALFARAATGSGTPGTRYPGRGDQGTDAIVGASGAESTLRFALTAGAVPSASLEKSQTVVAPNGGDMVVRGAVITYAIVARFEGDGTARAITVADPIPPGTSYVAGSLSLDDTALTDAVDGDPGTFAGGQIAVALGDLTGAATHTIRFKVKIL